MVAVVQFIMLSVVVAVARVVLAEQIKILSIAKEICSIQLLAAHQDENDIVSNDSNGQTLKWKKTNKNHFLIILTKDVYIQVFFVCLICMCV